MMRSLRKWLQRSKRSGSAKADKTQRTASQMTTVFEHVYWWHYSASEASLPKAWHCGTILIFFHQWRKEVASWAVSGTFALWIFIGRWSRLGMSMDIKQICEACVICVELVYNARLRVAMGIVVARHPNQSFTVNVFPARVTAIRVTSIFSHCIFNSNYSNMCR